jgi:phospholipid/cholesterol/gamma-HCH transport system permease protein
MRSKQMGRARSHCLSLPNGVNPDGTSVGLLASAPGNGSIESMTELLTATRSGEELEVRFAGQWLIDHVAAIEAALGGLMDHSVKRMAVSWSGIERLDLSSAWLLREALREIRERQVEIEDRDTPPEHFSVLDQIASNAATDSAVDVPASPHGLIPGLLLGVGRNLSERGAGGLDALAFFGQLVATLGRGLMSPRRLRFPSVVRHVYETGIDAIPIVALIAFLISVIVAYLGSQQLINFGAEIFTVDLVAIATLREMGVLLTAILVAGRSGSAFAAEIGVMELNDEVDALKAIGFDPFEILVLPRVLGLVIAMPLLTIIADAMGLVGGALLSSLLLDISYEQFLVRLQDALSPTTFWAGLIKAPVFAFLIAMVGTVRGMQVRDSSRELGRLTTVAVVQSIFLVILADALFAILFVELDF